MLRTSFSLGVCVGAVLGLLAVAASCSSFDAANDTSADGAPSGADGSAADGPTADALSAVDADVDAGPCAVAAFPTVLVSTSGPPSKVVTDGLNVFWTEGDVRLMRASLADCSIHQVDTGTINALAANASYVVWGNPSYRSLARTNLSASPSTHLTHLSVDVVVPNDVYWIDSGGYVSSCATPCVNTTNFIPSLIAPKLLAANASHIFYFADAVVSAPTTTLWAAAQSGLAPKALGTSAGAVLLAAASNQVYWVDGSDNLFSNDTASGIPTAHGPAGGAQAIAADDTGVYIATSDAIKRWAAGSGAAGVTLASNQGNPVSLTLTTTQLIWANATEKTLRRMLLPK
jgi:hypothetical protein